MAIKNHLEALSENLIFGGQQMRFRHQSITLGCEMTFSIYIPSKAKNIKVPVLYWLSGLTCTDENFVIKAGSQNTLKSMALQLFAQTPAHAVIIFQMTQMHHMILAWEQDFI